MHDPDPHDVAPWGIGPCSGPHPRYAIRIAPDMINRAVLAVPQLQRLGFHSWGVVSTIDVKDDVVCCFEQDVGFQRPDGHEIEAEAQMVPAQLRPEDGKYSVRSQLIRNYIHSLNASVLPSASNEEKSRAFDVNLTCLTSFRGCFYSCQLAPAVWEDLSRIYNRNKWALEGEGDPRCSR